MREHAAKLVRRLMTALSTHRGWPQSVVDALARAHAESVRICGCEIAAAFPPPGKTRDVLGTAANVLERETASLPPARAIITHKAAAKILDCTDRTVRNRPVRHKLTEAPGGKVYHDEVIRAMLDK